MRDRRSFLETLVGGVAGVFLTTSQAFGASSRFEAGYRAQIGASFALRNRHGERISAVLESVTELQPEARSPWRTVALQFRVDGDVTLAQDVYLVGCSGLERERLLLVPICSNDGRGRLEAILTRRRGWG